MDITNKCECDIVEVQCTFGGAKNYNYLHHQIYKRKFDNNSNADILPKTTISSTPSFEFPVIDEQGPDFYVVKIVKYVHKYVVKNPKICRKICKICRKMAKYVITFIRLFELKFKKINNKSI